MEYLELIKTFGIPIGITLIGLVVVWNKNTKLEEKVDFMYTKMADRDKEHAQQLSDVNNRLIGVITSNTEAIGKFDDTAKLWNKSMTELKGYMKQLYDHNVGNTKKN